MKSFYILRHQTVHYPTVKDNVDLELLSTPQCKVRWYVELLTTSKLSDYHTDLNKQAETMFSRTVYPLNRKVAVTGGGFSFSGSIQEVIQFRE